jgi:hypothetical protein
MPSRSTLQRDSQAEQRGSWAAGPTTPGARRPPSAPRERKPALAAVAVLLIAGGALGAGLLVTQNGKRVAAVEVSAEVGIGEQIPASALTEVQVASNTGLDYVPWNQASQVTQFYAAETLPPGTLLTEQMVERASAATAGTVQVGLALRQGQMPTQLAVGDHVNIYSVASSQTSSGCPATAGGALAVDAIVLSVGAPATAGGATNVTVAITPGDAGRVSCSASNGDVTVAVVPPGSLGAARAGASLPPSTGSANLPGGSPSTSPRPHTTPGSRK